MPPRRGGHHEELRKNTSCFGFHAGFRPPSVAPLYDRGDDRTRSTFKEARMNGQQLGPFCQSCAMPLARPEDFGTDGSGYRVNDYCHYCFANGEFTQPRATVKEMIDKAVDAMVRKEVMPAAQARALMTVVIPKLKRWQMAPSRQEVGGAVP
jgi:hypothetical protein